MPSSNTTWIAADPISLRHLTGWGHPESPSRYASICFALESAGLKTPQNTLIPRAASLEELSLCHTPEYISVVEDDFRKLNALGITDGSYTLSTGDVQISPGSWEAALKAVGAVLESADAIFSGKVKHVFNVVRPPGHHACRSQGMGFCIFNNIAIGARYAQQKYSIQRVLIVDWDVHHGNGTQDIFDDDPSVFYFSTQQKGIYPGTGKVEDKGIGKAYGTKLNIPIDVSARSRLDVLEAFGAPLQEAMKTFKPELVMISAGFDAHRDDPLGGLNLTENDFADLTRLMVQIANQYGEGRIISVLEGGYDLEAIAASAVAHVKGLNQT